MESKDDQILEDIANWTFPGIGLYYRDTPLTEIQLSKYKTGSLLRNNFFIDVTPASEGIDGNTRYLIASSKAAPIYKVQGTENSQKWKLHVLNANSYFKVLDIYILKDKTQILLLHIPKRWADLVMQGSESIKFDFEQKIIDTARQRFEEKMDKQISSELSGPEWREHVELPIGIDPNNNLCDINQPVLITGGTLNLYKSIQKLSGDQSGLNS